MDQLQLHNIICFSITQIIIHSAVKEFYRVPKFETVKDKFTVFHPDNEEDLLLTILNQHRTNSESTSGVWGGEDRSVLC